MSIRRNTAPTHPPTLAGRSRGQSMVEFALVLVPMLLLLLGAIQFGIIWGAQVGVTNAVRDAVRAASAVQPKVLGDSAGTISTTSEGAFATSVRSNVLANGLSNNVPFYNAGSATTQVCYESFTDASNAVALRANVTVIYSHPILIPLMSAVLGGSISTTTSLSIPVGLEQPYVLPPSGTKGCAP